MQTRPHKNSPAENGKWTLSPSQLVALDALGSGSSITEAAQAAQVRRETVSYWYNHDSAFIAAMNQRRQELWAAQIDRLRGLISKALGVLEDKLDNGSLRAAETVMKMTRTLGATTSALKTNPAEIEQAQQLKNLFDALATLPKDTPADEG